MSLFNCGPGQMISRYTLKMDEHQVSFVQWILVAAEMAQTDFTFFSSTNNSLCTINFAQLSNLFFFKKA